MKLKNGKAREVKAYPMAVKEIDGRSVTGIASVFGNIDNHHDIVWPGAYAKTIREQRDKIKHLWGHQWGMPPVAKIDDIREVGREELPESVLERAPEALGGLQVTRTYLGNPRAEEVFECLLEGTVTEMSIGYEAVRFDFEELEDGPMVRNLREIRLYETSDVLWGANDATAASKLLTPPYDALMKYLEEYLEDVKEGRRNNAGDLERINKIALLAIELGATNVKLLEDEESDEGDKQRRAGAEGPPLTLLRAQIDMLDLPI